MDKTGAGFPPVSLGYLDGFIDDDFSWSLSFEKQLVDGLSEHSQINSVYLRNGPLRGTFLNYFVYFNEVRVNFVDPAWMIRLVRKTTSKK